MIEAKGHNGQAHFDGTFVILTREGFLARSTVGKGEKRLPVSALRAVQWKPASTLVNGYIQFETAGGGTRSRFGSATTDAVADENSVVFTKKQMPAFEQFRAAVEEAITAKDTAQGTVVPSTASLAEELTKLSALANQGVLSAQEFEQAKARLLGS